ncbi:hypothetical protein [Pedobacter steynii]|uniref:SH3 domain-containing protein n=1 Tax=Pedobacter steynii TaxID=430522 RepID=A0A1D7QLF4_9SPHI|nr:hypothetical protein [Pedobacter steynii]AOM79506.1 hypothetical protein BFS30_21495 [Pedobacter steynii]
MCLGKQEKRAKSKVETEESNANLSVNKDHNMIRIILSFIAITLGISCSQAEHKSNINDSIAKETVSDKSPAIYGINAAEIAIRKGPGLKYGKVVNEKATQIIGETQYCEVGFSTKVVTLEREEEWTKIKVVDPEWLSDTYIGWVPSKVIITSEDQEKQSFGRLDPNDYQILKTNHNTIVENFHVLLKHKNFDKNYVYQFIKAFRKENCTKNCNVELYDSKSILNLIDVYPLEGQDYLKMADHLISISSFDASEDSSWYPCQNFKYNELGGKNWKKTPIK